jgi:hypothetical protein
VSVASATDDLIGSQEDVRDVLLHFIETYRDLPVLWAVSLKECSYKDSATCYKLVTIVKEVRKGATREDVKKISSLRTNCRKELNKADDSKRLGIGTDNVLILTKMLYFPRTVKLINK